MVANQEAMILLQQQIQAMQLQLQSMQMQRFETPQAVPPQQQAPPQQQTPVNIRQGNMKQVYFDRCVFESNLSAVRGSCITGMHCKGLFYFLSISWISFNSKPIFNKVFNLGHFPF